MASFNDYSDTSVIQSRKTGQYFIFIDGYKTGEIFAPEVYVRKFKKGETYEMRFIGDSDLKVPVPVIERTKKFITVQYAGKHRRIGVKVYEGIEYAYPTGRYSMAPSIKADMISPSEKKYKPSMMVVR